MHIGIIELCEKNHHSMIFNWIKISNINGWKVTLFTTKEIYENVKSEIIDLNYDLFINKNNSLLFHYKILYLNKKGKIDKLVYLTYCHFFIFPFICYKYAKFGITIHNVNTWFNDQVKFKKPHHFLIKVLIDKIKREASFFIVNNQMMKYSLKQFQSNHKPIYVLPFSLKKSKKILQHNNYKSLIVVYPGGLNLDRRRYKNFLQLAVFNPNDRFIILGNSKKNTINRKIFNEIKNLPNIILYNKYVSLKEFNDVLNKSHLVFYDIVVNYNSSYVQEIYGRTKDSGINYIINEFNIPCLINHDFSHLKELKRGTISFRGLDDLLEKYKRIKSNKIDLSLLRKNLINDTKDFNLDYYSEVFKKNFV